MCECLCMRACVCVHVRVCTHALLRLTGRIIQSGDARSRQKVSLQALWNSQRGQPGGGGGGGAGAEAVIFHDRDGDVQNLEYGHPFARETPVFRTEWFWAGGRRAPCWRRRGGLRAAMLGIVNQVSKAGAGGARGQWRYLRQKNLRVLLDKRGKSLLVLPCFHVGRREGVCECQCPFPYPHIHIHIIVCVKIYLFMDLHACLHAHAHTHARTHTIMCENLVQQQSQRQSHVSVCVSCSC